MTEGNAIPKGKWGIRWARFKRGPVQKARKAGTFVAARVPIIPTAAKTTLQERIKAEENARANEPMLREQERANRLKEEELKVEYLRMGREPPQLRQETVQVGGDLPGTDLEEFAKVVRRILKQDEGTSVRETLKRKEFHGLEFDADGEVRMAQGIISPIIDNNVFPTPIEEVNPVYKENNVKDRNSLAFQLASGDIGNLNPHEMELLWGAMVGRKMFKLPVTEESIKGIAARAVYTVKKAVTTNWNAFWGIEERRKDSGKKTETWGKERWPDEIGLPTPSEAFFELLEMAAQDAYDGQEGRYISSVLSKMVKERTITDEDKDFVNRPIMDPAYAGEYLAERSASAIRETVEEFEEVLEKLLTKGKTEMDDESGVAGLGCAGDVEKVKQRFMSRFERCLRGCKEGELVDSVANSLTWEKNAAVEELDKEVFELLKERDELETEKKQEGSDEQRAFYRTMQSAVRGDHLKSVKKAKDDPEEKKDDSDEKGEEDADEKGEEDAEEKKEELEALAKAIKEFQGKVEDVKKKVARAELPDAIKEEYVELLDLMKDFRTRRKRIDKMKQDLSEKYLYPLKTAGKKVLEKLDTRGVGEISKAQYIVARNAYEDPGEKSEAERRGRMGIWDWIKDKLYKGLTIVEPLKWILGAAATVLTLRIIRKKLFDRRHRGNVIARPHAEEDKRTYKFLGLVRMRDWMIGLLNLAVVGYCVTPLVHWWADISSRGSSLGAHYWRAPWDWWRPIDLKRRIVDDYYGIPQRLAQRGHPFFRASFNVQDQGNLEWLERNAEVLRFFYERWRGERVEFDEETGLKEIGEKGTCSTKMNYIPSMCVGLGITTIGDMKDYNKNFGDIKTDDGWEEGIAEIKTIDKKERGKAQEKIDRLKKRISEMEDGKDKELKLEALADLQNKLIGHPARWDPENPDRYGVCCTVKADRTPLDDGLLLTLETKGMTPEFREYVKEKQDDAAIAKTLKILTLNTQTDGKADEMVDFFEAEQQNGVAFGPEYFANNMREFKKRWFVLTPEQRIVMGFFGPKKTENAGLALTQLGEVDRLMTRYVVRGRAKKFLKEAHRDDAFTEWSRLIVARDVQLKALEIAKQNGRTEPSKEDIDAAEKMAVKPAEDIVDPQILEETFWRTPEEKGSICKPVKPKKKPKEDKGEKPAEGAEPKEEGAEKPAEGAEPKEEGAEKPAEGEKPVEGEKPEEEPEPEVVRPDVPKTLMEILEEKGYGEDGWLEDTTAAYEERECKGKFEQLKFQEQRSREIYLSNEAIRTLLNKFIGAGPAWRLKSKFEDEFTEILNDHAAAGGDVADYDPFTRPQGKKAQWAINNGYIITDEQYVAAEQAKKAAAKEVSGLSESTKKFFEHELNQDFKVFLEKTIDNLFEGEKGKLMTEAFGGDKEKTVDEIKEEIYRLFASALTSEKDYKEMDKEEKGRVDADREKLKAYGIVLGEQEGIPVVQETDNELIGRGVTNHIVSFVEKSGKSD